MLAGYVSRRRGVSEKLAEKLMWLVVVFGYPSVGLFAVWGTNLAGAVWLPVLAAFYIVILTGVGLAFSRLLTRDRPLEGLFAIACGMGNTGFTMGAFLCYLLFGFDAIGLAAVYDLSWWLMLVCLMYPLARHYAAEKPPEGGLGLLIWRNVMDIRSLGLLATIAGLGLNLLHLPFPMAVRDQHVMDVLMFITSTLAFFSIGLRLHASHVRPIMRLIVGLGAMRFLVAPLVALGLWALTLLTPWPLTGIPRGVFHVESCIPTAVTMVAIANLFHLRPREASALFVVNTLSYLAILPALIWFFKAVWAN